MPVTGSASDSRAPRGVPDAVDVVIEDVHKVFEGRGASDSVHALQSINEVVAPGEFVVLLGPSGCGKSTLLEIVAGLQGPTAGQVLVGGRPVRPGTVPKEAAMVFQEESLLPWRSVVDNIAFGLEARGVSKRERLAVADEMIARVGLDGFRDRHPRELSGGMKQRVAIARALAVDPGLLLMDEPFGALDSQTRYYIGMELLRIQESFNKTVLFVTHDINEAVLLADRVWLMTRRPGQIKSVMTVDIPKPRGARALATPRFNELTSQLWESLADEGLSDRDQGSGT